MKSIAGMLVLIALGAAASHAADSAKSVTLVRAMRSDEIAVATAKLGFLSGAMVERYGKTNAGCVKRIPYADFTAGWARVIESVLTAQEIDSSLVFLPVGRWSQIRRGIAAAHAFPRRSGGGVPRGSGQGVPPAQQAAIADFSRSDIGRKVMGKDVTLSPAAQAFGRAVLDQIAGKCGGK